MTQRECLTTLHLLHYLHALDYGQATDLELHARAFAAMPQRPSAAELDAAIANADAARWITGVQSRFTNRMKWSITTEGEAALHQMKREALEAPTAPA